MNSNRLRLSLAAAALLILSALTSAPAAAQTACVQVAPNRAHVCWARPSTYTDGSGISVATVITYSVELQQGTSWVNAANSISGTDWTSGVLLPGTYTYRVIACVGSTCSDPSNTGAKSVSQPVPNPVTITIAATDDPGANRTPVARILDPNGTPRRGEVFGLVPLGRACTGPVLYRYRSQNWRRVTVQPSELWGTSSTANLAAPCA